MTRRYLVADVFTDRVFGGNPLAVVLDAEGLADSAMQAIAREFNFSETTFVLPPADAAHTARVRIFTPTSELPFAGHPNVGTAWVLAREMAARGEALPAGFVFEEGAGLVPVRLLLEGGAVAGAELTAPQPLETRGGVAAGRIAACLRLQEADVAVARHGPVVASAGLPFLLVELASRAALRTVAPDAGLLAGVLPLDGATSVYLYTRDVGEDGRALGLDVQARMFIPLRGLVEDPATGSATAAAAGLLARLAGGDVALRFGQGMDMGRPSLLEARVTGERVMVGGRCVGVMRGVLEA